ncbi:hypothetical protein [Pseudomonas marginalis]|uniref:hypothetical protein n=1 Tax=Pseudomonas marginalis TaxID=298 RepID=UPI003B9E5CA9
MTPLTKLLLAKYRPELLQEPTLAANSKPLSVQGPARKSAPEAIHASTGMTLVMSSADYSESVIFKALREFNMANPQLTARSFTLPVGMNGIPAGSWVFVPPKDDNGKI